MSSVVVIGAEFGVERKDPVPSPAPIYDMPDQWSMQATVLKTFFPVYFPSILSIHWWWPVAATVRFQHTKHRSHKLVERTTNIAQRLTGLSHNTGFCAAESPGCSIPVIANTP